MMFTRRSLSVVATILLVTGGTWFFFHERVTIIPLVIGGAQIKVEVAQTESERTRGLAGRERLKENGGMLYVYPRPDFYIHSMKDMRFPLDIIWISADKKIVDYITDIQPESYPDYSYVNDFLAHYVLEANAGFFDKHNLKPGDPIEFSLE